METQSPLFKALTLAVNRLERDPSVATYFSRKLSGPDWTVAEAAAMRSHILGRIRAELEPWDRIFASAETVGVNEFKSEPGLIVWLTGLSAAGKSTIAR